MLRTTRTVLIIALLVVGACRQPTEKEKAHQMVDTACEGLLAKHEGACENAHKEVDSYFASREATGEVVTAEEAHARAISLVTMFLPPPERN